MTEVFPKLGGLPQSVIDEMLEKANDGMLLYTPVQKIGEEKAGMYYYLRCGSYGEIIGENIVCLKCCNSFQNDAYRTEFKGAYTWSIICCYANMLTFPEIYTNRRKIDSAFAETNIGFPALVEILLIVVKNAVILNMNSGNAWRRSAKCFVFLRKAVGDNDTVRWSH